LKVNERPETAAPFIIANKGWRGVVFLPFTLEGKNHPPPALGDCNKFQFERLLRGDEIANNDFEQLPCPVEPKVRRVGTAFARCGAMRCVAKAVPKGS